MGVSTVSRAINNHPDISTETRKQIQQVIAEYGYIPNNSARNLKRTESNAVAILTKGITNPVFNSMIKVFDEKLRRNHMTMILQHVDYEEDEVAVALELIKEKRLKGIIFLGFNYLHPEGEIDKISVPFVLSTVGMIAEDQKLEYYSHVTVDDKKESYKATQYLIDMGHKDIAIILAEEQSSSVGKLRLDGYLQAFKDNGIVPNPKLIGTVYDNMEHYSMENGYRTTRRLLDSGEKFTAVYATSDTFAVGVYRALREAGLRIPEDVSVMGYDGIELGDYLHPKLTTMAQPVEKLAMETFELLHDLIDDQCGNQTLVFECKLDEKESVKNIKER